ncbi:hypothetical protein [Erwinia sp. 198]|uniref:hypothetical protein n=1 Tax=Erwinia sp. 198 TaxID=2022746 RepID=UPI000F66786C|nr:hypothetical protein [Erwinia sp. 198]RRZ95490.1 hypothetical protein EGK14_02650 [Erwinia sp. 198]
MFNIASACWLNIAIGWANFGVFILVAFNFYKDYRETDYFILPFAIINITAAVALTLLVFCLTDLQRPIKPWGIILAAMPSVLVMAMFIYFITHHGVNMMLYFI